MQTSLSIVIVTWNSTELVEKQLAALHPLVAQIIVVDNNSSLSLNRAVAKYPNVSLIENSYNRGFAAACNQGLSRVTTEWVLFLNPDVSSIEGYLQTLLNFAKEKKLVAASIKSTDDAYAKPNPSVLSLLSEFTPAKHFIPTWLFGQKTLVGAILLIKTSILKDLGGWDERFFLWFEDSDLTTRLLKNDFRIGFCDIAVSHIGGFSLKKLNSSLQRDLFFSAMHVFARKHFSSISQWILQKMASRFSATKALPSVNSNLTSIVVPNIKIKLLDSFLKHNFEFFTKNTELIIVSSGLTDKTVWKYRAKYPTVRFIPIAENKGFAHTVNIGFRAASGSFVGTINDDVELQKGSIEKIIAACSKEVGSINPIILDSAGKIESAGISIEVHGKATPDTAPPTHDRTVTDATNGACVVYTKNALQKTGLFDERFGSYLEDIDLSLRLSRNGFANVVLGSSQVTHAQHQTTNAISFNKSAHDFKNWLLVIAKNWPIATLATHFPQILIERIRNFSGMIKANKKGAVFVLVVLAFAALFSFTRLYKIESSLLFFNDIGRDFLVLHRWNESGKPPLLGPQTSALPYNQSAVYFYLLYPMYVLTGHSPFATIYTAMLFYVAIWLYGVWYLRNSKYLQKSFMLSYLLMLLHPQFVAQTRFVWNPTFLGPLILLGFYSFEKLRQQWNSRDLLLFSGCISLAVSLNYSAAPALISFMVVALPVFYKQWKFLPVWITAAIALFFWNLPTLAFELRHGFALTNLLIYGDKIPQVAIGYLQKTTDLILHLFAEIPQSAGIVLTCLIFGIAAISMLNNHKKERTKSLGIACILLVLSLLVIYIIPFSVHAHYIFAVLTLLFIVISLLSWQWFAAIFLLLTIFWLQPVVLTEYISPARNSVANLQRCAKLVCQSVEQPLFVSVESAYHPYHNGMEYKYLFSEAGCTIKELDSQISEAQVMAVVVENTIYTHGSTAFNELTQFGSSRVEKILTCANQTQVYILQKE